MHTVDGFCLWAIACRSSWVLLFLLFSLFNSLDGHLSCSLSSLHSDFMGKIFSRTSHTSPVDVNVFYCWSAYLSSQCIKQEREYLYTDRIFMASLRFYFTWLKLLERDLELYCIVWHNDTMLWSGGSTTLRMFEDIRLVFTSDGVVVGVVIRSVERCDLVKIKLADLEAEYWSVCLCLRRLRSSENCIVGVPSITGRINQWQCSTLGLAIG